MQPFQFSDRSPGHSQNAHRLHPMQQMLRQKGIYPLQVQLRLSCQYVFYPVDTSVRETFGKRVVGEGFANCEIANILLQLSLQQCDTANCNLIVVRIDVDEPATGSAPESIRDKVLE